MSKANYRNYELLDKYLAKNEIEFTKFNGRHYRILGDVAIVDVWPARMAVQVIQTESVGPSGYFRLDYNFNPKQLQAVLDGKDWRKI